VIACGLSFLETSANTYSSLLGPIQSSTQRINFSQIFNSLGVISGVLIGQVVFGENDPSHEQLLAMPAAAADAARHPDGRPGGRALSDYRLRAGGAGAGVRVY
jgi:FHS family L-fucose permease-like MFS transporter